MRFVWFACLTIVCSALACRLQMTPKVVHDDAIVGAGANFAAKLSYAIQGNRVELVLDMRITGGTDQTEKLVSKVFMRNFNEYDGTRAWAGFVAPHQPIRHRVVLEAPAGVETASATLTLLRSGDSGVLLHKEFDFTLTPSGTLEIQE